MLLPLPELIQQIAAPGDRHNAIQHWAYPQLMKGNLRASWYAEGRKGRLPAYLFAPRDVATGKILWELHRIGPNPRPALAASAACYDWTNTRRDPVAGFDAPIDWALAEIAAGNPGIAYAAFTVITDGTTAACSAIFDVEDPIWPDVPILTRTGLNLSEILHRIATVPKVVIQ